MDVICHRACPADGPENSLEAARAIPDSVDMIEIDVQRCASGELVVFHDRLLDRLTDANGAIAGTEWSALRNRTINGTDATIPQLQSFLGAVPPSIGLNIELKHAGLAADLRRHIHGIENDVLVSSFVPQALAPLAEGPVHTAILFGPELSVDWEAETIGAESIGAAAVHPYYELVTADRVSRAQERGLDVNPWTVPNSETVQQMRAFGVDGMIVDDWQIVEAA